jgi:hypothetical protein
MSRTLQRYLQRHARAEHAVGSQLPASYDAAVVIPARNESPAFVQGLRAACSDARVVVVVVVNGRVDDPQEVHAGNAACLRTLCESGRGRDLVDGVRWVERNDFDLLLVDRASSGRRFGPDDGVGLARRMGGDIVASMWASGRLATPWIHNTDADAVLDREYLSSVQAVTDAVAVVHPYWHTPSGDGLLDEAVALYEIGLRWYVVGLAAAASWWAYATIGSCICVRIDAYAAVRGVPLRQAAEDFYLLSKLAKLGPVVRPEHGLVRLASRASDRVPFGTGPGVRRLMAMRAQGVTPTVYHPATFDHLGRTLRGIVSFAVDPQAGLGLADDVLAAAWRDLELERGLRAAIVSTSSPAQRLHRACEWFDAFRTLKLVHALRDRGLGPVPWPEALATFSSTSDLAGAAQRGDLDVVRAALAAREPLRSGNPRCFNSGS